MKRYDPVGVCIYCGAKEDLRDEHIIPLALNGDWLLPKASCQRCEAVTSALEMKVLRGPLWLPRVYMKLRSRRRNTRPHSFPLEVTSGGRSEVRDVPVDSNLPSVVLPIFGPAGFLREPEVTNGVTVEAFYVGHVGRRPEDVIRELGVDAVALQAEYPVVEFARMIAKIAYGYAVAELGIEQIKDPLVLPAIRGLSDDAGRWVGSLPDAMEPPAENILHAAGIVRQGGYIAVVLSLFAAQPAPWYLVFISRGARSKSP